MENRIRLSHFFISTEGENGTDKAARYLTVAPMPVLSKMFYCTKSMKD